VVDRNFPKDGSGGLPRSGPKNPIAGSNSNVMTFLRNLGDLSSPSLIDSMAEPNRARQNLSPILWIRPLIRPLPGPTSLMVDRRLGGRWTYPSATNWKKKDWP
jgi:hypothetical protein